ncbi:MAG: response regulator transcription factor [Ignavibacteriaceae bacterium]
MKIIIHTSSTDTEYIKTLVGKGIKGFINKNSSVKKIVGAIKLVSAGRVYIDNYFNFSVFKNNISSKILEDIIKGLLSKQEKMVLKLIFEGFENKAIAGKLELSIKTVETYKERIKEKLGVPSVKEIYKLKE